MPVGPEIVNLALASAKMLSGPEVASILVAIIAAGGAWASQRAAANASKAGTRLDAEKEAYERARKFDLETIERQDQEIKELRQEINNLKNQLVKLEDRMPLSVLGLEGFLSERLKQQPGTDQEQPDV